MYNYFNFKPAGDQILLTNDFGRYVFLSKAEFQQFLQNELLPDSPLYKLLEERFFLYSNHPETFLKRTREPMRYSKNYLFSGTALHIFVVTNRCNGNCVYCQAHAADSNSHGDMTLEVAEHAVDIALSSPARHLTFEFQGGEPLLNFKVIQHIVLYTEVNKGNKDVSFSVVSNLTLLTDDIMSFLMEHKVSISTSLDGPEFLHNQNRPLLNGQGCYAKTIDKVKKLRNAGTSVNAIQTTTKASLAYPKKIVDAYLDNGFKSIFLRPLTPLGYAACHWEEIGYTAEEFVSFYHDAFLYILERNREGVLFVESHAAIFLRKILYGFGENYMELRSPCGAALGQLAYYFDGNVYTCDEGRMLAEMGDAAFLLGSVFENDYNSLIDNSRCKATCIASVTEALPECCDCAYQPYCGVCPVINLAMERDIFSKSPFNYRCKIYSGMLDTIFEVLQRSDIRGLEALGKWL